MLAVTHHPRGVRVEIVGVHESSCERSYDVHKCCGKVIALDTVLRLRKVQIINGRLYNNTLCVFHVLILQPLTTALLSRSKCPRKNRCCRCVLGNCWLSSSSLSLSSYHIWWSFGAGCCCNVGKLWKPFQTMALTRQSWRKKHRSNCSSNPEKIKTLPEWSDALLAAAGLLKSSFSFLHCRTCDGCKSKWRQHDIKVSPDNCRSSTWAREWIFSRFL